MSIPVLQPLQHYAYDKFVTYEFADRDSILMNPIFVFSAVATYLYVVLVYGPAKMKNRTAVNVTLYTRLFNIGQIFVNLYIFLRLISLNAGDGGIGLVCTKSIRAMSLQRQQSICDLTWLALATRLMDFTETICFILAKKHSHVTFLHVYHHVNAVMIIYLPFVKGYGHIVYSIGVMNTFVHVIMYIYFLLSTFKAAKPYLWWKSHVTKLQIVQFALGVLATIINIRAGCPYPPAAHAVLAAFSFIFLVLFSNFYIKTYIIAEKSKHH